MGAIGRVKVTHLLFVVQTCLSIQVQSSNMRHLLGILHVAKTYPDVTHVLKNISSKKRNAAKNVKQKRKKDENTSDDSGEDSEDEEESFSVTVDVICNKGK